MTAITTLRECFDEALKLYPKTFDALGKATSLFKLERYTEALESYNEVLKMHPKDCTLWYDKGVCLYNLGRYREALESFDTS